MAARSANARGSKSCKPGQSPVRRSLRPLRRYNAGQCERKRTITHEVPVRSNIGNELRSDSRATFAITLTLDQDCPGYSCGSIGSARRAA